MTLKMYHLWAIPVTIYLLCEITDVKGRKDNPTSYGGFDYMEKQETNRDYSNVWKRSKIPSIVGGEETATHKSSLSGVQSNHI